MNTLNIPDRLNISSSTWLWLEEEIASTLQSAGLRWDLTVESFGTHIISIDPNSNWEIIIFALQWKEYVDQSDILHSHFGVDTEKISTFQKVKRLNNYETIYYIFDGDSCPLLVFNEQTGERSDYKEKLITAWMLRGVVWSCTTENEGAIITLKSSFSDRPDTSTLRRWEDDYGVNQYTIDHAIDLHTKRVGSWSTWGLWDLEYTFQFEDGEYELVGVETVHY